jgi:hypothetical protein
MLPINDYIAAPGGLLMWDHHVFEYLVHRRRTGYGRAANLMTGEKGVEVGRIDPDAAAPARSTDNMR